MPEFALDPSFAGLPQAIPVFPVSGVVLLPRGRLPLNVFEPRYLSMIRDALASRGCNQALGEVYGISSCWRVD